MSNFVPNEVFATNDKDPAWINNKFKTLFKNKTEFFKNCNKIKKMMLHENILNKCRICLDEILNFLAKFFSKHFSKPTCIDINPKCYRPVLKGSLNNKRVPCIRPLIHDSKEKHDQLSVQMIKLSRLALWKLLYMIFSSCMKSGIPKRMKKCYVVPVHKRDDKQSFKNYRPVFLLPILGKTFERFIYNKMDPFFY